MDEQKMPRRPRRNSTEEQPKNESLVYGKNPVTEPVSYTHLTLPTIA